MPNPISPIIPFPALHLTCFSSSAVSPGSVWHRGHKFNVRTARPRNNNLKEKKKIGFPINEGISCESDHSQKGLLVLSELQQDQILVCEWGVVH